MKDKKNSESQLELLVMDLIKQHGYDVIIEAVNRNYKMTSNENIK